MDVKVTKRTLGNRARGLEKRVSDAVYVTADDVETYVKASAPFDTGELQKSYSAQPESETSVVVGSPLDYSVYQEYGTVEQEYGTVKMAAQPHLTPAVDAAQPDFIQRLKDAVIGDE